MTRHSILISVSAAALAAAGAAQAAFFHIGSGSINGSLCVGNDCVSSEAFGFDTIRLKENNLRIHFDDTSSTASFPPNDWRLYANDSANGGDSYFGIEDATAGRFVFRVFAGARSNALTIDAQGDLGLGTATPAVDIDIKTGDTPTVRLQQDGTSGFTPQTWDMAGNEAGFFIRDATGGSTLPLRIRPGAPSSAIDIASSGNVGLGTGSPDGPLHVAADSAYITLEDTDDNDTWYITHQEGDDGNFEFTSVLNGSTINLAFVVEPDGDMTIDGTLTENSDKHAKMAIVPVDPAEVLRKVAALEVAEWSYIDDTSGARHIGPMAQDFHAAFGLGATETGISTLDTSGVALAAIQALMAENAAQRDLIGALTRRLEALEAQLPH